MPLHVLDTTLPTTQAQTSMAVSKRSVGASTSSKVLAEGKERKGLMIFNHSSATLYIDFGSSVSINDFAVKVPPGSYYEMLFSTSLEVRGVWSQGQGKALVREFI